MRRWATANSPPLSEQGTQHVTVKGSCLTPQPCSSGALNHHSGLGTVTGNQGLTGTTAGHGNAHESAALRDSVAPGAVSALSGAESRLEIRPVVFSKVPVSPPCGRQPACGLLSVRVTLQ